MGAINRGLGKLKAVVLILIFAGIPSLLNNLDKFFSGTDKTFLAFIHILRDSAVSAVDNLFASLWFRMTSLVPNIRSGNIGSAVWDLLFIVLATYVIYAFTYMAMDLITGNRETPALMTALIAIALTIGLAWLTKSFHTTITMTEATANLAQNATGTNVTSLLLNLGG